jgi:recombination protein RecA
MANQQDNYAALLAQIEKEFGQGTVLSGKQKSWDGNVISTGSLGLDLATGIGGLARGKVVELLGWESSGKSTIALNVIANAQKEGLKALLVDAENSFDKKYANALGINVEDLLVNQIDEHGAEKCYNVAERLIQSGQFGVVVFDSQTALIPKKVMAGDVGDSSLGLQARMVSGMLPKIVSAAAKTNTLIIFISQLREKIGVMFGNPVTTGAGGNALKFYAHMRIDISKTVQKDKNEEAYGNKTKCKVIKNKMAAPYGETSFEIIWGQGVDTDKELIDIGSDLGIIQKAGAYFKYNGSNLGQGIEKAKEMLQDNPGLREEIKSKILTQVKEEKVIEANPPQEDK